MKKTLFKLYVLGTYFIIFDLFLGGLFIANVQRFLPKNVRLVKLFFVSLFDHFRLIDVDLFLNAFPFLSTRTHLLDDLLVV